MPRATSSLQEDGVIMEGPWRRVGGSSAPSWALEPKTERARADGAVAHVLGGAAVGAAPHVAYGAMCEELSRAGFRVVATPYALTFEHLRCAEDVLAARQRAMQEMGWAQDAPVVGVGHSNGSLLHLLAATRGGEYAANALVSFNNLVVSEAVPGGIPENLPTEVPSAARQLTAAIADAAAAAAAPSTQQIAADVFAGIAATAGVGAMVAAQFARDVTAQLPLAAAELERGTRDFTPSPEESRALIREGYRVPATLLVRYTDDSIDQTPEMESLLLDAMPPETCLVQRIDLEGNHASACGPASLPYDSDAGAAVFTPIDAIGMAASKLAAGDAQRTAREVISFLERSLIQ